MRAPVGQPCASGATGRTQGDAPTPFPIFPLKDEGPHIILQFIRYTL
jgi:hypothetical protein